MRLWGELKGRQRELFKKKKKEKYVSLPASIHAKGHVSPEQGTGGLQIRRALPSPNQHILALEHEAPELWKAVLFCLNHPVVTIAAWGDSTEATATMNVMTFFFFKFF